MAVSAQAACTITTTSMVFGVYDMFSAAPLDTNGSVVFRCDNKDKDITISIDRGGAPSFNPRRLLNGSQALNYNLYLNAARTVIWGDGTGGTQNYFNHNPNPNNQNITIPIYGRIFAGQDVGTGAYTNTLTVTIDF